MNEHSRDTGDDGLIEPLVRNMQRALLPIIYGAFAAASVAAVLAWRVASPTQLVVLAAQIVVLLLLMPLVKAGKVRTAAWLTTIALLVGCSAMVWAYGSLRSIATLGYAFAALVAAVFLTRREMLATIGGAWLCIALLAWRESTRAPIVPLPFGWYQAVILGIAVLLAGLVVRYARTLATSAMRQTQEELRERERAEERLRLSMEATQQGWFDLDIPTGTVHSSEHFQRLMGAPPGSAAQVMTHDTWVSALHHADRDAVLERFEQCLQSGEMVLLEYRLMGLDGVFRWIRSTAKVVQRDGQGRPLRLTGTHADITDQRAVTLALESSERSYRTLVEMSPVGVVVLRDAIVRYANPAALQMLGAPDIDTVAGAGMETFVPHDESSPMAQVCHAASKNQSVVTAPIEQPMMRLDGERFDASIRCSAVVYEGRPSLQFSFVDISAQKQAEEARLRSRQLEALGTLAGGIAHDFNNILFAIRGNAELIARESAMSAGSTESVREILAAGQRASELVRRIGAFARPKEPCHDAVSLPDVLGEVLRLLRPTVPAGISLDVDIVPDTPPILADAAQVHEAIVNLTANAVYAIGQSRVGRVTYVVDCVDLAGDEARSTGVDEGRYTRLTVRDTGPGMTEEVRRRVFDAFYTTKPVGEGTGLGLSMVYGTMRSHGGAIGVESTPGEGATFRLLFPSAVGGTTTTAAPPPHTESSVRSLRVLFVDDELQLVRMAERTLSALGHQVSTFSDPVAALARFRAAPDAFDVVVTDLSMPHMSGLDLVRALRSTPSRIPIVMVTGYADDADEAEAYGAGVTRLAVKATDAHQLKRLLAEVAPTA